MVYHIDYRHVAFGFKPQRGKFTLILVASTLQTLNCFKRQRGKFTPYALFKKIRQKVVSNPNGVNLHVFVPNFELVSKRVSNPNGVNLHLKMFVQEIKQLCFKPQRGKFTRDTP